jgi:uncharacterized protein (TIGR02147 family)
VWTTEPAPAESTTAAAYLSIECSKAATNPCILIPLFGEAMAHWKPDIFSYLDYRAFLRDCYQAGKENVPSFSYRYLCLKAGFSSPNFVKLVLDGDRNLGQDSIPRLCKAFDLTASESRFFCDLVVLAQETDPDAKTGALERVASSRRFRQARRIDQGMFRYLSRWYYPAIREMAARKDFVEDPAWIAKELVPPIKQGQAKEALEVLLDLGYLERDEEGKVHRGNPSLTTGHEVMALGARAYHRQMLERAAESIELVDRNSRDISALTVCIEGATVADLKDRIHRFRETLLERCDGDEDPDVVYQINIQLFPLAKARTKVKK